MSDVGLGPAIDPPKAAGLRQRFLKLVASRGFQKWAARFPLTRGITRREGEAMFDLVAGFAHTQCLSALVSFGTLDILLAKGPLSLRRLASVAGVPQDRMRVLLDAGVALGLLRFKDDIYSLTRRGAALTGVPGLADMIRHHAVLYRDLADPEAFFRGETRPELARFWPYVFGAGAVDDPETAERYSHLMTETQALVADETLAAVSLRGFRCLMDVGGGTGAFLRAAMQANSQLDGVLFDLPDVVANVGDHIPQPGSAQRIRIVPGSFRDDPLPEGSDVISLVRVLYDHSDNTVSRLLGNVFNALPSGGMLLVSEPMTGGDAPTRAGNAYFAIYTMAMETGRTRSPEQVCQAMRMAGFTEVRTHRTYRPFVTSVVTGRKP